MPGINVPPLTERSGIWAFYKDQIKATKVAVWVGRVIAVLMMVSAIYIGNPFLILIGFLIFSMGSAELKGLIVQKKLEGKRVRDLMKPATNRDIEFWEIEAGFKVIFCQADADLLDVIKLMQANKTTKIFVKMGEKIIGAVTAKMIEELFKSKE